MSFSTRSKDSSTRSKQQLSLATRSLSGWGRYPSFECEVVRPEKMAAFSGAVDEFKGKTLIARGLGRSYGDVACNPQGVTVLTERLNRVLEFNEETGLLKAEAGVSLADLLQIFVPRGWMPPVVPGTKFITLGGAVAADIHGKNHHRDGSFSRHVQSFELIDGLSQKVSCSRQSNAEAFWATVGGMGLTGLVTDIELQMQRIPSAFVQSKKVKAGNLTALMEAFSQHEDQHAFSVAWIDCLSGGSSLGRGVLFLGDFLPAEKLVFPDRISKSKIPCDFPDALLNRFSIGAFNELFYQVNGGSSDVVHLDKFFFPLDQIHNWNRMYGKRGFVQYQCLFPTQSSAEGLKQILTKSSNRGWGSFLAVLKRFGAQEAHTHPSLSFPDSGYTLTLDFPMRNGLQEFIADLDAITANLGGRIYLAKDALSEAKVFKRMYSQLNDWQRVRDKLDPKRTFVSALSRRLGLVD